MLCRGVIGLAGGCIVSLAMIGMVRLGLAGCESYGPSLLDMM